MVAQIPTQVPARERAESRARRRGVRRHRADRGRLRDGRDLRRLEAVRAARRPLRIHVSATSPAATCASRRTARSSRRRRSQSKTNYGVAAAGVAREVRRDARHQPSLRASRARWRGRTTTTSCRTESQNDIDYTVALGNADLQPTTSWNVDVLGEHYFKSVGVVSAGFFYKQLRTTSTVYTYEQPINGTHLPGHAAAQRRRGHDRGSRSRCRTSCVSCRRRSTASASTPTTPSRDSTAQFPSHTGDSTLPGQSKHVGNVAVSYEKARIQRPGRR